MESGLFSLENTIYLAAILGLLGLWLFHYAQVRAGRIQAVDLFDRSVVRIYVYVTTGEGDVCDVCAQVHGRVFLSSRVTQKHFRPIEGACKGKVPCQSCLVGLYGGWLEARELVARIQKLPKKTVVRLTGDDMRNLVKGDWKHSVSAETDRISVNMLEARCEEQRHADLAVEGYRFVTRKAKEERHLPLIVPAYLRLISALIRTGREDEARQVVEEFERRFPPDQSEHSSLSVEHRQALETQKALLWERRSLQVSA